MHYLKSHAEPDAKHPFWFH